VQKVAFHIGSLPVYWYGVLVALAFVIGLWTASRRALRDGLPAQQVVDAGVWLIAGSVLGARTLYVLTFWQEEFAGQPWTKLLNVREGGLVFYGGFIGATAAGLLYVWKHKVPVWKFADALAPSLALGYAIGRLGCLMNGCCHGRPTDLPWALHYPAGHAAAGAGVHPTQLYDAGLNLALCVALAWLHRRKRFDGQVFATHLVCYALLRSFVELFRGDYGERLLAGWLTPAHFVSALTLAAGAILIWKLPRRPPAAAPAPARR
jgi:phosphatidylglycerol:prolipoprotein diacylglycerol transferase